MMFTNYLIPSVAMGAGYEAPAVTALHAQKDGSLLCGLSFSKPQMFRVKFVDGQAVFEDLAKTADFDDGVLAVVHGLRASNSGDTSLCVLHNGMLPGFLGGSVRGKKGQDLLDHLEKNEGGLGLQVRHSIVQLADQKVMARRFKDPGMLWDVIHVGAHMYGAASRSIWREPYLNTEKREVMRKDLGLNRVVSTDADGNFWFADENHRLMRMGLSDIKPKRTPLKLPDDSGIFDSSASFTDGWLYLVCESAKAVIRVRMNPVSREEESQRVCSFDRRIGGICAVDDPRVSKLFIAVDKDGGFELHALALKKSDDPEMVPPVPPVELVATHSGVEVVNSLTASFSPIVTVDASHDQDPSDAPRNHEVPIEAWEKHPRPKLWVGEGYLGWGRDSKDSKPRIVEIAGL
jgi:hypothetical protein